MLTWDDAVLSAIRAGGGAIRALITTTIDGTTYRFIDEPEQSLTLDGETYQGIGDGIAFSGVPSQSGLETGRFSFTIPAAALVLDDDAEDPIAVLSSIYDEDYENAEIDVDYALFASAPGDFIGTLPAIAGRITSAPLSLNPSQNDATLSIECQTLGQDFTRTNAGSRGSAHYRRFHAADSFGDFIVQAVTDQTLKWGIAGDNPGGGNGGFGARNGSGGYTNPWWNGTASIRPPSP